MKNTKVYKSDFFSQNLYFIVVFAGLLSLMSCAASKTETWQWEKIEAKGEPTARHEAGMVAYKNKILLMGGRRINPTDVFDTENKIWTAKASTPIEIHHFQPVVVDDAVYIIGGMTGQWPNETPLDRVVVYYPEKDEYVYSHEIPEHRRRGGAGVVAHNGKIYVVGGITKGHMNGYQPWFDVYDPKTGEWKVLPDAPGSRDHFHAAVASNKLYAFAGRKTSKKTGQDMALTNTYGNVYDFEKNEWLKVTDDLAIPTQRAGNAAFVWKNEVIVGGGESIAHEVAHNEVQAYNIKTKTWRNWPSMIQGRHGTGYVIVDDYVYMAAGSGNRGGGPELTTIERLKLPSETDESVAVASTNFTEIRKQWHTVELNFEGPKTSEDAADNPFLNYLLQVEFKNEETNYTIRGFYAADGNASESSADQGNIWSVRFTPEELGDWTYSAVLYHQDNIALKNDVATAEKISISNATGGFKVVASDKEGVDFRAHGRLVASNGYYKFTGSDKYWMKVGANSPENLLGYVDFDDTYRMEASNEEGEASTTNEIHSYPLHLKDWKTGDPTWKDGKGKALIGALNYLASTGMNSVYFLTMNILGDGKDVWPYAKPDEFNRFDVSKLEQWEIVFRHMQSKGLLLHIVLQETENETLLDGGDTGPLRQLYLNELMARFGHHLALNWNLGEENGPAHWSPLGQNDAQRKAMAKFIKESDAYNHPVLLHTHAQDPLRSDILDSIVGYKYVDGLSLQQEERTETSEVIERWKKKSEAAGNEWLITMDEIGKWYQGAVLDSEDPTHDSLRKYVLWGTLLSGGAGVEWYFGAKHPHNDLNSEDWRERNRLWQITNHARVFFEEYLPFWQMKPEHSLVNIEEAYCFREKGEVYALFLPDTKEATINLLEEEGEFQVHWFDPVNGGELQLGSVTTLSAGAVRELGVPPTTKGTKHDDWVCLLKKI
ncbi:kelch repeat-containing protein [Zobellia roscoffensis]|uniref:Kelch repeat-containing protein n=1 Tax=Zobellia roscoffensis TaxID=2779508 RepID=UPI00188A206B|nr:kelch repeat-containing protein [Zobellia roscoffensis]